eukprot:g777.t1
MVKFDTIDETDEKKGTGASASDDLNNAAALLDKDSTTSSPSPGGASSTVAKFSHFFSFWKQKTQQTYGKTKQLVNRNMDKVYLARNVLFFVGAVVSLHYYPENFKAADVESLPEM